MIVGLRFNKILLEKTTQKEKTKIANISTKTDILELEEEKTELKDQKVIKINFSFKTNYDPEIAKIVIEGSVLYLSNTEEIKEILNSWKNKELIQKFRIEILNYILIRCNIKALSLEEELNLPPHIPLPKFVSKKDKSEKTDYAG